MFQNWRWTLVFSIWAGFSNRRKGLLYIPLCSHSISSTMIFPPRCMLICQGLATALYVIFSKIALQRYPPLTITAWAAMVACVIMAVVATSVNSHCGVSVRSGLVIECLKKWMKLMATCCCFFSYPTFERYPNGSTGAPYPATETLMFQGSMWLSSTEVPSFHQKWSCPRRWYR